MDDKTELRQYHELIHRWLENDGSSDIDRDILNELVEVYMSFRTIV
jgi:hypothetical protein